MTSASSAMMRKAEGYLYPGSDLGPYQIFHSLPPGTRFAFERFLFNEPFHLISQPCPHLQTFYLLNGPQVMARISFFFDGHKALSPFRSTFGSLEWAATLPWEGLHFFWTQIEATLLEAGIESVSLKHPPLGFEADKAQKLTSFLLDEGFEVSNTELNFHLDIKASSFEARLHPSEKRRLRKCLRAGMYVQEDTAPDLRQVYDFIAAARLRKNYPLTLGFADFEALFTQFPAAYQVFVVKYNSQVVALSVTVRLNGRVLYNFYPADHAAFLTYSPSVLLHQGLWEYARQKGFEFLDLGIATDGGVPNLGLIRFKRNLGAEASLKLSFHKSLQP